MILVLDKTFYGFHPYRDFNVYRFQKNKDPFDSNEIKQNTKVDLHRIEHADESIIKHRANAVRFNYFEED